MNKLLLTGGAGFIGSAVVRKIIRETDMAVVNVDKLTYAGNLESLAEARDSSRHFFEQVDICNGESMSRLFSAHEPDAVMHLAAESHVDRSIDGPGEFMRTNIMGTYNLLQCARDYWTMMPDERKSTFKFHHVSTDEVYGSLGETGYFTETTRYRPNSPYSASKAASDHLVRAWHKTYGLPVVTSNCSNNYGPYQFPEKLIPLLVHKALDDAPLPIYGSGDNVRDWLFVEDHADALLHILSRGRIGEVYNVGGNNEKTNLEVVRQLCEVLDERRPRSDGASYANQISFVEDRPGHDKRYAIDASKLKNELGWEPRETFESGLRVTVDWYLENTGWCDAAMRHYRGERLGVDS